MEKQLCIFIYFIKVRVIKLPATTVTLLKFILCFFRDFNKNGTKGTELLTYACIVYLILRQGENDLKLTILLGYTVILCQL